MDRIAVTSKVIASKGYNALTKDMEVEFANGDIGSFKDLPVAWSSYFDEAVSKGTALWEFRKAGFGFEKRGK